MNFFESQARSRSKTTNLVVLFLFGLLGLLITINLLSLLLLLFKNDGKLFFLLILSTAEVESYLRKNVHEVYDIFFFATTITICIVVCGTYKRITQLSSGGKGVAELLGATLVNRNTTNELEKRLINVTDEMAIASGITPPEVYLLEEESINAMAAGYEPSSAVIIVNKGTLESLNRDELQAVIAHEFSHIFNGDMRLNIRLIGVIAGITCLVTFGRELTRPQSRRSRNKIKIGEALFGYILIFAGSIGVFFASLIQAAVSRQREFLADATAVQYTRNPQGLINSFLKILNNPYKTFIQAAGAIEVRHMFFASPFNFSFFESHPSIKERILAIDKKAFQRDQTLTVKNNIKSSLSNVNLMDKPVMGFSQPLLNVGQITKSNIEVAKNIQSEFSESLKDAVQNPHDAAALLFAILMGREKNEKLPFYLREKTAEFSKRLRGLMDRLKFPLVGICVSELRNVDEKTKRKLIEDLEAFIAVDGVYTLFEVSVLIIAERGLLGEQVSLLRGERKAVPKKIDELVAPLSSVLWGIVTTDDSENLTDEKKNLLFSAAVEKLFGRKVSHQNTRKDFKETLEALRKLDGLDFHSRKKVLEACWECAFHNKHINLKEREMLRAIHCVLDCPMPPSNEL